MESNTDIIVPQYPSPARFEEVGRSKTDRPYIPSEYAHSMGNSTGNFQDYWDIIEQYDNLQGGFIWDWVDQSIWKTNEKGERFYAYGGDYGKNMPTDNTFLNNGIVFPDRTPKPALFEVKKAHEYINFKHKGVNRYDELRILVENLYDFTNLDQFDFHASIKADGEIIKNHPIGSLSVESQTGKLIRIPLNDISFNENTEYFVEISAIIKDDWGLLPKGFKVANEQIPLSSKTKLIKPDLFLENNLIVEESNEIITITSHNFKINFNKSNGRMTSYNFNGTELIIDGKGPKPNFWRAVTDNDFGNRMHKNNIEWKRASTTLTVHDINVKKLEDGTVEVNIEFDLPGVESSFISSYTILGNGVILINNTLNETNYKGDIPRIGMRMQLPRSLNNLTYFGRGPWENYQDRRSSTFIDVYSSKVRDQYVPYIRPQDNGYKTDCRWLALSNENNNGILFVATDKNFSFSALHMENEDFDTTAGLNYEDSNTSKHTNDIKEKDLVQLNIDLGQRGVGGDDSWYSKPQDKYQFKGDQKHEYSFYMIPFNDQHSDTLINFSKLYKNQN
jgi:beta-galactosidase